MTMKFGEKMRGTRRGRKMVVVDGYAQDTLYQYMKLSHNESNII